MKYLIRDASFINIRLNGPPGSLQLGATISKADQPGCFLRRSSRYPESTGMAEGLSLAEATRKMFDQLSYAVQCQPNEAANHGAVDADELQVFSDLLFDPK